LKIDITAAELAVAIKTKEQKISGRDDDDDEKTISHTLNQSLHYAIFLIFFCFFFILS
jgi:hypothetical protein